MDRKEIIILENQQNVIEFDHDNENALEAVGITDESILNKALQNLSTTEGCTSKMTESLQKDLTKHEIAFICASYIRKYTEALHQMRMLKFSGMMDVGGSSDDIN